MVLAQCRMPVAPGTAGVDIATTCAAALLVAAGIEAVEGAWQVGHDAGQLQLMSGHLRAAARAVPAKRVEQSQRSLPLDHGAQAAGLWSLWRMLHMRRQQEDVALAQIDPLIAATIPEQQVSITFDLVEKLL